MEMLQILKYRFRRDRLDFTEGLVANERELTVIDVPKEKVEELFSQGRIEELQELLAVSYENWDARFDSGVDTDMD